MPATPEALRKAITPSRAQIVLAAACLFPWYGLAALCADHGIPCVLGHALSIEGHPWRQSQKRHDFDATQSPCCCAAGCSPKPSWSLAEVFVQLETWYHMGRMCQNSDERNPYDYDHFADCTCIPSRHAHGQTTCLRGADRTPSDNPQRLVRRAKVLLAMAAGANNSQIARQMHLNRGTVCVWRHRWRALTPKLAQVGSGRAER